MNFHNLKFLILLILLIFPTSCFMKLFEISNDCWVNAICKKTKLLILERNKFPLSKKILALKLGDDSEYVFDLILEYLHKNLGNSTNLIVGSGDSSLARKSIKHYDIALIFLPNISWVSQ